jgi:glucarate dehydratase
LGVEIDREKLLGYAEYYREIGGYPYDRDPGRPQWFSIWPETRFADPSVKSAPIVDAA